MPKIDEEKKEKRRKQILETAMELISEKGYVNTTMDDIVKASGISKGGIYLYFKSKEEIFLSLAGEVAMRRRSIVESLPEDMTYSDRIKTYINKTLANFRAEDSIKKIRFSFEFWLSYSNRKMLGNVPKKKVQDDRYDFFADDIKKILVGGIKAGEFREDIDPESVSFLILCSFDGIAVLSALMDQKIPERMELTMGELFADYLRKK